MQPSIRSEHTPTYDHRTGELPGEPTCHYCGALVRIIPEFAAADFHDTAKCVEGDEPVR